MLRVFQAEIGRNVHLHPSVRITIPWNLSIGDAAAIGDGVTLYALGKIRIGARATVSQGAHLCAGTHDWRASTMPLLKLPIYVGDEVWVCAEAFIGPGVSLGDRSVIGARAVAMRDVPVDAVVAGNPARVVSHRTPADRAMD